MSEHKAARGWSPRNRSGTGILGAILFSALLHHPLQAAQTLTLAWDQSTDPTVAGYRIHYGGASRTYTNQVSVGQVTTAVIPDLTAGAVYYFAATAYSIGGVESVLSEELSYAVPPLAGAQLRVASTRPFALMVNGASGHTYEILTSPDLKVWTIIGLVALGGSDSLVFVDPNTATFPRRFFRARDIQP